MNDNNMNNNPNPLGVLTSFSEPVANGSTPPAPSAAPAPAPAPLPAAPVAETPAPAPQPVQPQPVPQQPAPAPQPAPVQVAPQPQAVQPAPQVVQPQPVPQQPAPQPMQMQQMPQPQQTTLPPPKPVAPVASTVGAAGSNDSDKLLETDRFVIAYIGKDKYFYFLTKGWNWPFFFLSIFYLMYRKMYGKVFSYMFMTGLVSILTTVLIGLIPLTADLMYSGPVGAIVVTLLTFAGPFFYHLYFTSKVNSKYYEFAQKKSKKVEYVFNNFSKDVQEEICAKRGRGTFKNFVVGFILYAVLGIVTSAVISLLSILIVVLVGPSYDGTIEYDELKNITVTHSVSDNYMTEKEFGELEVHPRFITKGYDGKVSYESYIDLGTINGPSYVFIRKDFMCLIEYGKVKDYRDAEKLVDQYSSYHTSAYNILQKMAGSKGNTKPPKPELIMNEGINWYQISLDELKSSSIKYKTQDYFSNMDESIYHVRVKAYKGEDEGEGSEDEVMSCFDDGRTFVESLTPQNKPSTTTE